jgi:hypothetical protein
MFCCADLRAEDERMLAFVSVLGSEVVDISDAPLEGDMMILSFALEMCGYGMCRAEVVVQNKDQAIIM